MTRHSIAAVGIANQRETAIIWGRAAGEIPQQSRVGGSER
ncbi:Glycerol kinase [Leifsonia rubra CMS 76R]|nr:Glycerol kinase [Leifsonia rubra CMS 76R]